MTTGIVSSVAPCSKRRTFLAKNSYENCKRVSRIPGC